MREYWEENADSLDVFDELAPRARQLGLIPEDICPVEWRGYPHRWRLVTGDVQRLRWAVEAAEDRLRPCADCGSVAPRWHRFRCDVCEMRGLVAGLRDRERRDRLSEARLRERRETRRLYASMSPARQQLADRSGIGFSTRADLYAEVYGEW